MPGDSDYQAHYTLYGEKDGYHLQDTFFAVLGRKIYINVVFFLENRGTSAPCVTGLDLFD